MLQNIFNAVVGGARNVGATALAANYLTQKDREKAEEQQNLADDNEFKAKYREDRLKLSDMEGYGSGIDYTRGEKGEGYYVLKSGQRWYESEREAERARYRASLGQLNGNEHAASETKKRVSQKEAFSNLYDSLKNGEV